MDDDAGRTSRARVDTGAPLSTLRGARVEVDTRRAVQIVIGICLVALAVVVAVLFVAGASKNSQIAELREHGVRVNVTVSKCLGQLGGSGSNAAGYSCSGTYVIGGHRYEVAIPGSTLYPPGSHFVAVSVVDDPGLFATVSEVNNEYTSAGRFVLPSVLLVVLCGGIGALVVRSRRSNRRRLDQ